MIELGKGWKTALDNYQKKTEDSEKDKKVAIIGHTGHQQWWNIKTTMTGLDRFTDVYEMMAKYCQKKLELYKETGYDLEFAKVETLAKRKEDL